jgi:hypothetical protein
MAFKKAPPPTLVPDSPEKLILDLPRRKIPDVMPHQSTIMRAYASQAINEQDVALQLPTGSGKTLVGLLIAEWLRRKNQERVVYLCPTRQLVNQAVEQAEEKYGLTVLGFTGSIRNYDPTAKTEYRNADRIVITTYSSLFNTNPFFNDANVLIVDDAHAAEGYVTELWSVHILRKEPKHDALHAALQAILKPHLDPTNFTRLSGQWDSLADLGWVDKVPTPVFSGIRSEITEVLDAHTKGTDLEYPWSMIREHLLACHLYLSSNEILIRPLIPPTWTHAPFQNPRQRIYMSATLGGGGDLERLMGRRVIRRLPISEGWDQQGVGRRFFIFPGMSLKEDKAKELHRELMRRSGRSLVLVPNDTSRKEIAEDIKKHLGFTTFDADDIETSKKPFVTTEPAVAVIANRYDGVDFPGNECRLLFIEGLPKTVNLQERFLMARMGSTILLNERIQTRILQAIGRCTRSLEDFSAVVISGDELQNYLVDIHRREFLHPELQAEINFGVEQSKGTSLKDIVENFETFLENGEDWEGVNQQIVAYRKAATQKSFPAMDELSGVVSTEIEFQARLWQGDYEAALDYAEHVLGKLAAPELRGYRALWHYLAGSAAWLGCEDGVVALKSKAQLQFAKAKSSANGIPWLVALARYQTEPSLEEVRNSVTMGQIERVETILAQLGTVHDRGFAKREKYILEGLMSEDKFEDAHKLLGELLGFDTGKVEEDGSPDPWWIAGDICLVFEDHAGAREESALDVKKARQAASHPAWMRANVAACAGTEILSILISPVTKVKEGAVPHIKELPLWQLNEFRAWAQNALAVIRELRRTFIDPGDLVWRVTAAEAFEQHTLDAHGLFSMLQSRCAVNYMTEVR